MLAGKIKINAYALVSRAVEEGVGYGYNRAHKHVDTPEPDDLQSAIVDAVMNSLCEYLIFEDLYAKGE